MSEGKPIPSNMNASWVLRGSPNFNIYSYASTPDMSSQSGVWECEGPKVFDWQFHDDEAIYILEGYARIEYEGKTMQLRPGNVAFFAAGTHAVWHVPERVRKAYNITHATPLQRVVRRLIRAWGTAPSPREASATKRRGGGDDMHAELLAEH